MKVAPFPMTRFSRRLTERIGWPVVCALASSMLVPPGLVAASPETPTGDVQLMPAVAESGPAVAAGCESMSVQDTPPPQLRLTQVAPMLDYGFSCSAPPAGRIQLEPMRSQFPTSGRRERLGMTGAAEILAWSTGIGAVVGLASGLRQGENAVESTLKGAGLGFILPIALGAMAASTFPGVAPVQPVLLSDLPPYGRASSRLRGSGTPLLELRISGQRALGRADRHLALGVGAGIRLSYVAAW
jgi:hypothetical protein